MVREGRKNCLNTSEVVVEGDIWEAAVEKWLNEGTGEL